MTLSFTWQVQGSSGGKTGLWRVHGQEPSETSDHYDHRRSERKHTLTRTRTSFSLTPKNPPLLSPLFRQTTSCSWATTIESQPEGFCNTLCTKIRPPSKGTVWSRTENNWLNAGGVWLVRLLLVEKDDIQASWEAEKNQPCSIYTLTYFDLDWFFSCT